MHLPDEWLYSIATPLGIALPGFCNTIQPHIHIPDATLPAIPPSPSTPTLLRFPLSCPDFQYVKMFKYQPPFTI